MSRGQSQMRTRSARAALRRCNNRSHDNTIIVDVDISKIDVIIVDSPESSNCKSRCSKNANRKHFPTVIFIEEDDDDNDNDDDDDVGFRRVDHYATSSRTFHPPSSNSYAFEELDSDECQMLNRKGKSHKRYSKRMFVTLSSDCTTSKIDASQRDTLDAEDFEDDCSDCLIMDGSSVKIREEWEKAALKKKSEKRRADSQEGIGASGSHKSGVSPYETSEDANLNGTSCDTYTVRNKGEGHSDANNSADRMDVLHSAPLSDHTVGECSHETCDPKKRNEPVSGKTSHRCHSQPNVSSYHEAMGNSCGQDVPLQGPLSHDHGSHSQIDGVCSLDTEDNKRASLFTTELRDESQCEDRQRHENLSPCNRPGSSQNMPGPQTGNVAEVAEDSSNFQPQDEHASGGEEAVFQGSMGNIQGDMNPAMIQQSNGENMEQGDMNPAMIQQSNGENMDIVSDNKNDIIGKWERFKESDEYKRVEEEEWASRKRELLIQSEEAQRMRRLRKRKKAESLRLLDMEKRQKQRLEEIRESQKRDEETINLKEQIRVEIQKDLKKLEMAHRDMVSLLRGLGINVSGGLYPLPHEVNAAYKQALLRFHPDRASRADIRQQVEAEEKFKLISRWKEKLLPVA